MAASASGDNLAIVRVQAERILADEALGRSYSLEKLFRFLLACTLEGRSPKEFEVADAVFGRSPDEAGQDASIRVHIHRLRRKLDEYYRGAGATQAERLTIPKADYRLTVEPLARPEAPAAESRRRRPYPVFFLAALGLALVASAIGWWVGSRAANADPLDAVRGTSLWQPLVGTSRRTAIVVGDYYIFGERDPLGNITRLVREFDVNSARDLQRLNASGTATGSFDDVGLSYLPVGVGNAMRVVAPIIARNRGGGVVPAFVVPSSQLSPELVKYTNLIYLGYLSALGPLRDPLFSRSRFGIGSSYDEIVDRKTGKTYSATTPLDRDAGGPGQDYAIVSSFKGVTGNTVLIVAGTRDAGLMQAAEFVARPEALAELGGARASPTGFDALLAIESLKNVGLRARLIAVAPRKADTDWSGRETQAFPDAGLAAEPAQTR